MTAAEKIKIFASVDDIILDIECDRQSTSILNRRYAVRFIMLDNFTVFQELSLRLASSGINTLGLETLLSSDNKDKWITQDELKNVIKNITKSTIVSPFSEIARFYDDDRFITFFNEISLLENSQDNLTRRIYIPLIGLESRFIKFLDSFGRISESAPVWSIKTGVSQPVIIYLTPSFDSSQIYSFPKKYRGLETMYDWLLFWKTKAPTDKIICSSLPININFRHSQPDNIFDIKPIKTAYEFITEFLNVQFEIEYKASDEYFWIQFLSLLEDIKADSFSFKDFVNKYFNVYNLTVENVLNIWSSNNTKEFDRWLLRHYFLRYLAVNQKYLRNILIVCPDYTPSRLIIEISLSIFEYQDITDYFEERNKLLLLFEEQFKLPDSELSMINEKIKTIAQSEVSTAMNLCSGRFDFEKELFIEWYKVGKLTLPKLQDLYYDLAVYLKDFEYDSWSIQYIQAYKQAKLEDKYTNNIKEFISNKNADEHSFYEWYHTFALSKELLALEKPDKIYWLDGVGIEYLSIIKSIIDKSPFKIQKIEIARTGIPSSTEHNRFDNVIKRDELDSYIHSEQYKYPFSICKEIDIIKLLISEILNQSQETTIAIVSDHGMTALSRLVDSKKYLTKSSHEGRYIKIDSSDCIKDSDYIRCKNGDDSFKVALTHASLDTKPVREVHGGCTPEEILVPFILISNINKKAEQIQATETVLEANEIKKTVGFEEEDIF